MKDNTRHIRWFLGMAIALLCLVVCRVDATTASNASAQSEKTIGAMYDKQEAASASLCEKEDDMLHAAREMGCWAMPSTSVTLQGAAGRMLSIGKTLQRVSRVYNALYVDESRHTYEQDGALRHTLQTKRFHTGYYIYYRCQMRC